MGRLDAGLEGFDIDERRQTYSMRTIIRAFEHLGIRSQIENVMTWEEIAFLRGTVEMRAFAEQILVRQHEVGGIAAALAEGAQRHNRNPSIAEIVDRLGAAVVGSWTGKL